ncbi:MAG: glutamine amidotransferase [Gemmatimonadota bacterium]|nr:glutamine amidotransferase [Gemmatimonadota bacterium]
MASFFDSLFAALFKYRPAVFEKGELAIGGLASIWLILGVGLLIGVPAVLSYARAQGKGGRHDRIVLGALRAAALLVLVVCLTRPRLLVSAAVPQRNYVGILLDDSRSMRVADGEVERGDVVRRLFAPDAPLVRELGERFQLRFFRFSSATQRIERVSDLSFTGGETRIAAALEDARQDLSSVPLSGLVVVTDGADNARTPITDELSALRSRAVPVFTVGVGSERFARDVEVRRVEASRSVLRGTALVLDVLVAQRGFGGERVSLVVEDAGRIVSSQEVTLPDDGEAASVRIHVTAAEPGPRTYTVRVPPQPREMVVQNNAQQTLVHVRDRVEKILYVEGDLRSEMAFLRRAVERDSNLQVVALQRSAASKFIRFAVDSGGELASGFPKTREELFRYKGVIIGSVEASFFTRDQLRMLADFVGERGGGLIMLGGRASFAEGGYSGTPLADVLPVALETVEEETSDFIADLKVRLTPAGRAHAATQVAGTDTANVARWRALPEVTSVNQLGRLKPGAVALLTGSVAEGGRGGMGYTQPVLAYQQYGRGRAIALGIQDSWLWQMDAAVAVEDQTHETFWRQLLRWLVTDTPGRVDVALLSDRVSPREPVTVRAEVGDEQFVRVNDAAVTARVRGPSGDEREIPMEWTVARDGEYRATFTPEESGLYAIHVAGGGRRAGGATAMDSATTYLRVAPSDAEYFGAEMRAPLLRRIASETEGRFYTPATVAALPEDLTLSRRGVTVVRELDLWDMPVIFVLLVMLVSAEWGYRKLRGLA